jgi:exonuclease SbcC
MPNRFLTEIKLENFQDHKDSTISLTNGINLIVGSSDAGKSAILRAVNFVFHNNLKGDSFIRHGSNECKVTLKFSDGVEVTRIKGNDTNSYQLKDSDGNQHSFPKVGTSVPEEIKKQLGQPPLDDKKRPISYADQMANLFLVDLSPSDLPRTLSELTGIQNLQNAAEALSKNARSFDRVIKEKNDKLQKLNADLENYAYVDKDLESIETIETKLLKINSEIESTNKARQFIIDNNKIVVEAKDLKKKIDLSSSIINLIPKFSKLEKLNEKLNLSKNYLKTYKVFANEFNSTKSEINKLKTFRSDSNLEKYNDLQGLISSNDEANNFLNLNDVNIKEQNSLIESIDQENNKIISYKKELKLLIEKLKVEGNWCDSCNRPLI